MKFWTLPLLIGFSLSAAAQRKLESLTLLTGNAAASLPISGTGQLFKAPYHPYISLSGSFTWREREHSRLEQNVNIGLIVHQFVQTAIPLFTEFNYARKAGGNWVFKSHLGVGYFHSIPASDRFELNENGVYEQVKGIGRAQGMFTFALSTERKISDDFALVFRYSLLMQGPFVKSYVPLLPYNTLQLGVKYQLKKAL